MESVALGRALLRVPIAGTRALAQSNCHRLQAQSAHPSGSLFETSGLLCRSQGRRKPLQRRCLHASITKCYSQQSSFLGHGAWAAFYQVQSGRSDRRRAPVGVRASKGPLQFPKPKVPIEVSNILTVLTTLFLIGNEPLFRTAGLTDGELHRTVIGTQAVGLFVIIALTFQSYVDLRALREATENGRPESGRPESGTSESGPSGQVSSNGPSEAQAEVVDNADLLKELGRDMPSKDELKIFVTSGEGKKTRTLRLEEGCLDSAGDYEALVDTVRKIVPQLAAYPLTVLYQVRQSGEFFLLEPEDDVAKLLGMAGFVYIHPSPSWE